MLYVAIALLAHEAEGRVINTIVADSLTHTPLSGASVFDRHGKGIGMSDTRGRIPYIAPSDYPLTVRYLGYKEGVIPAVVIDTFFMQGITIELPEVVVESRNHKVLHMLAYVREYSTLTTYADTVFLFREKMVDYMLPPTSERTFKGWTNPRILKAKSYYRFTNAEGLDSVSDESRHHFSWSDWIGAGDIHPLPDKLKQLVTGTDTVKGKYSPAELWIKNDEQVAVNINVLADTLSRQWVPNLSGFFQQNLEFENFRLRYCYDDIDTGEIRPDKLTGYSFNIESRGRGHNMFRFNKIDEPFFVNTFTEIYILDKEYITVKEAKKWERHNFKSNDIEIYEPIEAPELPQEIQGLIAKVNTLNKDIARLNFTPDPNMGSRHGINHNFRIGNRLLLMLKQLTGITLFKSHKNFNRQWDEFRKGQQSKSK